MTSTTTSTVVDSTPSFMTSSVSSLSSTWNQPPNVAKVYKQSFQLFLTRRTQEAWDSLQPIVLPPRLYDLANAQNGDKEEQAPVAAASRNARIKVWNLYISILNIALELGSAEGKREFGASEWTKLASSVKQGSVWHEVAQHGYGGQDGKVDAEVVASLATLMIAHAPTQKITQQRLEAYLSTSGLVPMDTIINSNMDIHGGSATTLKELNSRLKIIEIFTLHVLPRNQEWDYAREFIRQSGDLDEKKREGFLQTLQALQDEPQMEVQRKEEHMRELKRQRDEELEQARMEEKQRQINETAVNNAKAYRKREDDVKARHAPQIAPRDNAQESSKQVSDSRTNVTPRRPLPPSVVDERETRRKPPQQSLSPPKQPPSPPPSLYRMTTKLLQGIQYSLFGMGQSVSRNPLVILRTLFFIFALLMALARRDVRDRLEQVWSAGWEKVKRTVGMGVKVSYI